MHNCGFVLTEQLISQRMTVLKILELRYSTNFLYSKQKVVNFMDYAIFVLTMLQTVVYINTV
jgi:hypothetical protein